MIWRVRDRETFVRLAATPRRRHGSLSLVVLPGTGAPPRLAFTVGRRVGGAVVRNRIRRRLRASMILHRGDLAPGATYLLGAAPAAAGMTFAELDAAVTRLLASPGSR